MIPVAALALSACEKDAPIHQEASPITKTNVSSLTGTLHYSEAPRVMSVEAYMHVDFTLTTSDGKTHALAPGPAVDRDALRALDGKTVTLDVRPGKATPPSPGESAPQGADGNALPRPARVEVLAVHNN